MINGTNGTRQSLIDSSKSKRAKKSKAKRKGILISVCALFSAGGIAATGLASCSSKKNETDNETTAPTTRVEEISNNPIESLSTLDIGKLGAKLDYDKLANKNSNLYSNPVGNININNIVEKNGELYVSSEAASKADNIGKEVLDDKGGTLVPKSDGSAQLKQEYYEIVDENGNIKDSGEINSNGLPNGYHKDDSGKIVKDGTNYYIAPDGSYWKDKKTYEEYIESLKSDGESVQTEFIPSETTPSEVPTEPEKIPTTPQETPTTPVETPSENNNINTDEGVVNPDGTYTIFDMTFESKADYDQWVLQGYTGYGIIGGMMRPVTSEISYEDSAKVLELGR